MDGLRTCVEIRVPGHGCANGKSLADVTMWTYNGRTFGRTKMAAPTKRTRSERLEVRTTPEDRELINRAVAASGTDLPDFVRTNLRVAALRELADRTEFDLDAGAQQAWEKINRRRARNLAGLRDLMDRPSPFTDE